MRRLNLKVTGFEEDEILTREQLRQVLGGNDGSGPGGNCRTDECVYRESPNHDVLGKCETNSKDQCVCNAGTSSVVHGSCSAY